MPDQLPTINLGTEGIAAQQENLNKVESAKNNLFVKINKAHQWMVGASSDSQEALPDDCLFAARVDNLKSTVKEWADGKPGASKSQPLSQGVLTADDITFKSNPKAVEKHEVKQGLSLELMCVIGPLQGHTVVYDADAQWALSAIKELATEFAINAQNNPAPLIPVIQLKVEMFNSSKHGELHKPKFEVHYWDTAGLEETRRRIEQTDNRLVDKRTPPPSVRGPDHAVSPGSGGN